MPLNEKRLPTFQHTAARRRLQSVIERAERIHSVSTHSRPKAAADSLQGQTLNWIVSTHSRPKAAATNSLLDNRANIVSTHSRPKAAAYTKS